MTAHVTVLEDDDMISLGGFFARLSDKINKVVLVDDDYEANHGEIVKVTANKDITISFPPVNKKKTLVIGIQREKASTNDVTIGHGSNKFTLNAQKPKEKYISVKGGNWKKW